ncbi:NAD-dependent malic enzyme [Paenibacillus montanisoli]|uniref:NAD-dependent malic enzyme n=1 Tax=Paenibacillus montanisoli TaxID=2081970 RepID=A0A328U0H5_9BACL|nr:NAD-dependent malic enzyme [Paenibacillus montanisoli]RAP76317.1 NAD-dependent malic enzyme [Paenibacillus montanisoli]
MSMPTGANTSVILRLELQKENASFGTIATAISESGGDIVAIDVVRTEKMTTVRDLTINVYDSKHTELIVSLIGKLPGVRVIHVSDQTFLLHLGGKIEMSTKYPIKNRDDLSRVYTPGVARVCTAIAEKPSLAHTLTIKRNTVAVVSDGSAVLGLGNIGPEAAMPVMEGKAMLFKQLGGVDAFPICLDTQDTEEIIRIVKAMAPTFGGINLEDISAPRCFEIEERLVQELDIPVFHDDQHGTAVVLLSGLLNAVKLVGKRLEHCKVVVCGLGAAGTACTKMLMAAGVANVVGVDRQGAIIRGGSYDNPAWQWFAEHTNPNKETGLLSDVIQDADIFIGVSGPGVLKPDDVKRMAKDPIVFAMANPTPEILPEEAEPYVRVMATGRSDYPNQINNVLCFPGMFRGVLDCRASRVTEGMKLAAARAIASVVSADELNEHYIIPSVFNQAVVERVREAVIEAAYEAGVARRARESARGTDRDQQREPSAALSH